MKRSFFTGAMFISIAAVLVGGSVAISDLLAKYPPLWSQSIRYALGAIVLILVARLRRLPFPRLSIRELWLVTLLALTGLVGYNLSLLAALRYSDPAAVGAMLGALPIFLALIGPMMQFNKPQVIVVLGAIIVSIGTAIAQGFGTTTPLGVILSIGALLGEVSFSLLAVPLLPKLGSLVLLLYTCIVGSLVFAALALISGETNALPPPTVPQLLALGYLAFAATAGACLAWYAGLARLGAAHAGLFSGLIPVSSLVCAGLIGTTTVTLTSALGCLLVAVGVVIGSLRGSTGTNLCSKGQFSKRETQSQSRIHEGSSIKNVP